MAALQLTNVFRCAAAALVLIASALAYAQEPAAPGQEPLSVDVDLVLVHATVTDPEGRYVTGLEREHFQIWEDKVEQSVAHFSIEDAPMSVSIVLDISGSMKSKIDIARDAAVAFLKIGSLDDEYLLIEFSNRPEVIESFTTDVSRLQSRLILGTTKGMTALYDAMYLAVERLRHGNNPKKTVLLITGRRRQPKPLLVRKCARSY
jgi:Ca-activated chloride channel family protein